MTRAAVRLRAQAACTLQCSNVMISSKGGKGQIPYFLVGGAFIHSLGDLTVTVISHAIT